MNRTEFIYQNYWLRVFVLLPIIVFLPYVEKNMLGEIDIKIFYLISTIITFLIAFIFFKPLGFLFKKRGKITFLEKELVIERKKEKYIRFDDIVDCTFEKKYLYGSCFCVFNIEYMENGKERNYTIVSEDLISQKNEDSSLWNVYKRIESIIR